ncbi:MAG: glycosyltransferase family 1 protein, partial [Hydrogenothermaceae bacterium]
MSENITKPRVVFLKTPDPRGLTDWIVEGISKSISANGFETKIVDVSDPNAISEKVNEIIEFRPLFTFDTNLDGMIFG